MEPSLESLVDALEGFVGAPVNNIGFGNRLRRDDGAGSVIADRLSSCPGVKAVDGCFTPENHL